MRDTNPNLDEAATLALKALGWILSDEARADRLLALTGLDPQSLRGAINDRATQAALLAFLEAHEADLIACSVAIDESPAALIAARGILENSPVAEFDI